MLAAGNANPLQALAAEQFVELSEPLALPDFSLGFAH